MANALNRNYFAHLVSAVRQTNPNVEVIPAGEVLYAADPSLLRILARAHQIQARLIHNPKLTMHDIAREEQVSATYLNSLLPLPWLAPDITTASMAENRRNSPPRH